MSELFYLQNIFQPVFSGEFSNYSITNAIAYYALTLSLIYCIYRQPYYKSLIFSVILGSSFIAYIIALIIELRFALSNQVAFIDNYFFEIKLMITIVLWSVAIATILWRNRESNIPTKTPEECEPYVEQQIEARVAAEQRLAKLETDLEHKILERTTSLGLANQDLQENASLMEKVANLTPNILYIYDLEKQRNVYSNRFVGEVLGFSQREIEEMNIQLFDKLLHPEDRDLIARHHQNCLHLQQDDYLEIEYRMQDSQGNWHWLQSKDTVFERDAFGKPIQILGITQDITKTKEIQSETARLNAELAEKVKTLEQWHEERIKLAKMNEFLQACVSIEEAKIALTDLLQPLFPNIHGAVYLMNNSKNILKAIAAWGIPNSEGSFEPHECWALRRGNIHIARPSTPGLFCDHVNSLSHTSSTLCLPMNAKGTTLGMLYLRFIPEEGISELMRELAATVAQNVAMSFANLKLQEKLRYQSLRDPLTGLYNRRYLQEALVKEIDRARRKQHFIGIIAIDIDHFKRFNDVYGHSAGDLVLQEVGIYLLSKIRQYDLACRYGGEELIIIMPDASIEDTVTRAEEIRAGIKQLKLEHESQKLESIAVSIGVSCFPDDGIDADSLIRSADRALYRAKEQGRDCVKRT